MPRHSDEALRTESAAVAHHCWMLEQTQKLYADHLAGTPDRPPGLRQALAGAFAIHARCLHGFFYPGAPRDSDVIAEDYIPNWPRVRPERCLSPEAVSHFDRELAHLTTKRRPMPPEGFAFDVATIYAVLRPAVDAFWSTVPPELLCADVQKRVLAMPVRDAQTVAVHVLNAPEPATANAIIGPGQLWTSSRTKK